MFGWLKRTLGLRFVSSALSEAGSGKYGPKAQAAYWWAHNHAAWIGCALYVATFVLEKALPAFGLCGPGFDCTTYDGWVKSVGEFLVGAGFATQAVAVPSPEQRAAGLRGEDRV
jgi:hypothetical protein